MVKNIFVALILNGAVVGVVAADLVINEGDVSGGDFSDDSGTATDLTVSSTETTIINGENLDDLDVDWFDFTLAVDVTAVSINVTAAPTSNFAAFTISTGLNSSSADIWSTEAPLGMTALPDLTAGSYTMLFTDGGDNIGYSISFTPVPEPSAFLYGGFLSVLAGGGYRIKRRAAVG